MNPRAVDLIVRSVTTAVLAVGVLVVVAWEAIRTGTVDATLGAAFGLIVGVYFGAHVSQNGAGARSRAEALAVQAATGQPAPPDPYSAKQPPAEGASGG